VTGTISDSISWKPSARRAKTASERFSFAGARTDTGSDRSPAADVENDRVAMQKKANERE
jgi:hypothetical protein